MSLLPLLRIITLSIAPWLEIVCSAATALLITESNRVLFVMDVMCTCALGNVFHHTMQEHERSVLHKFAAEFNKIYFISDSSLRLQQLIGLQLKPVSSKGLILSRAALRNLAKSIHVSTLCKPYMYTYMNT